MQRIGVFDSDDEVQLLAGLRARDDSAFERFEELYVGMVFATARRMLRNEADAQDATQEAFIGAYTSIQTFDGRSKLSTWLTRIAINKCLMKLRSRRRSHEVAMDSLLPAFKDDGHPVRWADHWRPPGEEAETRERIGSLVRECLEQLPDNYRTVLLLRDVQGLSTEETAEVVGDSPNAVKVRLHRARLALRTLLNPLLRLEETP